MAEPAPLQSLLEAGLSRGGLQTDDVLAVMLPLLRQAAALHEQGRVAALDGVWAYQVAETGALTLAQPEGRPPALQPDAVARLQAPAGSVLRIVGESEVTHDAEQGLQVQDLAIGAADPAAVPARPVYLPGYVAWEHRLGHHDALADILCLGQVLAGLSCGLDFCAADDLRLFVAERGNLFRIQQRLHPVVAAVIVEMTELDRHRRARDLPSVVRRLETYREQPQDLALGRVLMGVDGGAGDGAGARRRAVQVHLRDRLFDLSRRNRLLYFRPTQSTVNLTVASVPLVVDLKSIRPEHLCVWGGPFAEQVLQGERVALAQWLRFEDQPYLAGALDRIIQEARRDRAEYGFAQLSLVLAFLRWHNLKEDRDERIGSPLLLLPVELTRRKGVRDQYLLQAGSTEAEVNPVLRQQLRQLYDIALPATVALREQSIAAFHAEVQAQIAATEPGVRLDLVREPAIELIHQRARQRLEQFRRRQRTAAAVPAAAPSLPDYSYSADDFRPLGLKLFHERVHPAPLPLRDAVGGAPVVRRPHMAAQAAAQEAEAATFALHERAGNPYQWELDLTAVTLGNFNYRKMSLVRDYNALIETDMANPAFDRVFSLQPRPLDPGAPAPLPPAEQWAVVSADATQTAAVALARQGTSYIIQGPPGTGKSQTITNLIADYIGRGKRVLFVCEKRAAIDVVFHRLRQQGLDELCCVIHDSQADKKAFVLNLKQTYEHWLATPDELDAAQQQRHALLAEIGQDLQALQRFDAAMRAVPPHVGASVRDLLQRLVALHGQAPALTPQQREALPSFAQWQGHADLAARLERTLAEVVGPVTLAQHVFAHLGPALVGGERPLARLAELTDRAEALLDACGEVLAQAWPAAPVLRLGDLVALAGQARQLEGTAARGQLALLDAGSAASGLLEAARDELAALEQALDDAAQKTRHWQDRPTLPQAQALLAQCSAQEASLWRWLQPSWWRLRGELRRRYDLAQHPARPRLTRVLADLVAEYQARAALQEAQARCAARYGTADPRPLLATLAAWREQAAGDPVQAAWHRHLLQSEPGRHRADVGVGQSRGRRAGRTVDRASNRAADQPTDQMADQPTDQTADQAADETADQAADQTASPAVTQLAAIARDVDALAAVLDELLRGAAGRDLDALGTLVRDLREHADVLPDLLPLLQELAAADPAVADGLRTLALPAAAIEYAVALESLERVHRSERWLPRFDGAVLARHAQRLAAAERRLLDVNARTVRAAVRRRFSGHVQRSSLAASQLDAEGKLFKKAYSAGRRELEHEFGKTMRYKAIRELASAESGQVVRDMKPVWLMSPLSVSDTLPLAPDLFDVVIFDEASQIPVEEAVPALYRAPQVIVVGDEMQLPPTSFFASAREAGEDQLAVEEEGERFAVVLDADSLLNQGARNLPATLLAWHYRSRHEALIGYSNAAFYAGNLYTIPDRSIAAGGLGEIVVQAAAPGVGDVAAQADALLARAISFHLVADAVYAQRRNEAEARYIAWLVRELLNRETGRSLGIVAFSEAQQSAIESALAALGESDAAFAARLEAEYTREEDDQFCGLFVKNLENVQGDERDIIVLSICYGRGPDGRMLMNFGPINQRGGEKRLNVIFSRARHHMAVVSSIRHDAITNSYNEGAAALQQFLRYAEHASRGDRAAAQRVLEGLNPMTRAALGGQPEADAVVQQLAAALRGRGHAVDERVGQSRFRCDLAVRDPQGGPHYALAILVDTAAHYANPDVLERYVSRPRILGDFGWRTVQVLARDWLHDRQAVLEAVERALRQAGTPPPAEADGEPPDDSAPAAAPAGLAVPQAAVGAAMGTGQASMQAGPADPGRHFECTEGTARKFWRIRCEGRDVTVQYGRIGTQGQTQLKQFASDQRARQEVDKLVAEKLRKGYAEVPRPESL